MNRADGSGIRAALMPRSIALVGASDNANKIGGRPLAYLSQFGYQGRVYAINPHRATVQGRCAYPSVASLPEAPDLAIIATSAEQVADAIEECGRRGVKAAIVMASGFGETSEPGGGAAERMMAARARAYGMRLIGPNSQGLANFGCGAVASFSTMFRETTPADGPVGIVSQSGMMSVVPYGLLRAKGIGVRHAHATGNDADVTLSEVALAVVEDPAIRLLLLYIESIRDPETLAAAAALARQRDVPIVAVKTGRTPRGQAAARSHTGALANEDRVVDAFFRHHGIWRARDVHELVAGAELYLKEWRPQGRRVAVVSNSGATCVMAADTAYDLDLELASLSPVTVDAVASQLPSYATVTNPIDITAALLTNSSLFETILARLAADDAVDMLFVGIPVAGAGYDVEAFGRAAAEFADTTGRPIVVAAPQESVARAFRERGVPTFANQTEALGVLKQLAAHTAAMRRPLAVVGPGLPVKLPAVASRFLNEADGLSILERHGFPTVVHRLCASEADARTAFRELGVPVVVKACSTAIPHKSDHGLVVLDIVSETGVTKAFRQVTASAHAMGVHLDGVIVAAMALGRRELMIGARVDPTFGAVVMIGDGGRYVEALSDVAVLLPPMTVDAVRDALRRLRIAPILAGVRGEPALDVDALSDVAERLCQLVIGSAGQIASIDLNPVIVQSDGRGLVIVDALVERAPESIALRTEARAGAAAVSPGT